MRPAQGTSTPPLPFSGQPVERPAQVRRMVRPGRLGGPEPLAPGRNWEHQLTASVV
jgi:hypothetical protein